MADSPWPLHHPHPWDLTPDAAVQLQRRLARRVREEPLALDRIRTVAGVDVGFPQPDRYRAGVVVLSFPQLQVLEEAVAEGPVSMEYVPGLLSFRELPGILAALQRLHRRPDVFLVDGQGRAHPRGLGIASHLGVLLDWPTVGVAKSVLVGRPQGPLGETRGSRVPLLYRGRVVGMLLRTRTGVKPVVVSVGHRVDLAGAVDLVLATAPRYRLPEPIRAAHRLVSIRPGR